MQCLIFNGKKVRLVVFANTRILLGEKVGIKSCSLRAEYPNDVF